MKSKLLIMALAGSALAVSTPVLAQRGGHGGGMGAGVGASMGVWGMLAASAAQWAPI